MKILLAVVVVALAGCGSEGPAGPRGAQGKQGEPGAPGDGAGGAGGGSSASGTGGAVATCDAGCCADEDCPAPVNECMAGVCVAGSCAEAARPHGWPCSTGLCSIGGTCNKTLARCAVGADVYACDGVSYLTFDRIEWSTGAVANHCDDGTIGAVACATGTACSVVPVGAGAALVGACL